MNGPRTHIHANFCDGLATSLNVAQTPSQPRPEKQSVSNNPTVYNIYVREFKEFQ